MVTNKDLWDECEVNILMNGGTYGTRLSDSRITNEQLTTPVSSHHLPLRLVVAVVLVVVKK